MIIDAHCHAGPGDGLTGPWDTNAPIGPYLRRAAAAGIHRTVVMPAFSRDYGRANARLARIIARHPERLIGFAFVHSARDAGQVRRLVEHAVTRWGFRGIKLHRMDARVTREICRVAREFRLPILYDVAGETDLIDLIAPEYPDVNFIVPHLGSFGDDWRAHVRVVDQIARLPNLYADTAGVRRFDYLLEAVRRAGPHKLIFGSDGPWLHPGVELHKVRLLGLPPADEALVLGGNISRLLGARTALPRRRLRAAEA